MEPKAMWSMFLQTGSPEVYLLYTEARKAKGIYVSDNSGFSDPNYKI